VRNKLNPDSLAGVGPKVSQYIAKFLKNNGVGCVFELSGGMIMDLIDSIYLEGGIEIVNIHHEQSAAFAADAMGRLSGIPGVAIATSGPGAINLLTGIGSCFFDSSPAVFITGQVKTNELKGDKNLRQVGFQETDIVTMVTPITKSAYQIRTALEIPSVLARAFRIAVEGRPGPVLLDIPMELFRATIQGAASADFQDISVSTFQTEPALGKQLVRDMRSAKKPLILVGGGVRASGAFSLFKQLVARTKIPTVSSLLGIDCIPRDSPNSVGMIGTYGNRWANLVVAEADFMLVLGSRLDIRQTGANTDSFKGQRTIYHVNIEPEEINNRVKGCVPILANLPEFITSIIALLGNEEFPRNSNWEKCILELKQKWPDTAELQGIRGINPNHFMHKLAVSRKAAVYSVDVGQHQMWAAQSIDLFEGQRFITSGGMGAMGFGLPAAIGAAFYTKKEKPILVIAGDAGFQLNIQELQTVMRNNLPIKIVIINNKCHGMTRQFQETYFQARYQASVWGYDAPDFERVAQAYGLEASTISAPEEIEDALAAFWREPLKPYLLQVMVDTYANVYPKMAFGKPISEMEPFAKPNEMEGT